MKFILDTNVYIDASLSEIGWRRFEKQMIPLLPFIYLSSVVVFELKVASERAQNDQLLERHVDALEKVGRLITPTFEDWTIGASFVGRKKARSYLCDILIGCSVRRLGALLFTFNIKDFLPLSKELGFEIKRPW